MTERTAAADRADGGPEWEDGAGEARDSRFGAPVELPWWVVPLGLPPLVTLVAGLVVSAPISGRLLVLVASAGMLWVLGRVGTRVRSTSMQSVWISAVYPFWLFMVLLWAVEAGIIHGSGNSGQGAAGLARGLLTLL